MHLMNKIWRILYSQSNTYCAGCQQEFSSTFPVSSVCTCNFVNVILFHGNSCGCHRTRDSAYYLNVVHVVASHFILLQLLFVRLQTLFYTILALFNTAVALVWTGIKIPFVKLGTFLYKLGPALLGITQLTLHIVYCSLVLWISCYCVILIYRFLQ